MEAVVAVFVLVLSQRSHKPTLLSADRCGSQLRSSAGILTSGLCDVRPRGTPNTVRAKKGPREAASHRGVKKKSIQT